MPLPVDISGKVLDLDACLVDQEREKVRDQNPRFCAW